MLSYSGRGSDGKEKVYHTPQIFKTGVLTSDALNCHVLNIIFFWWHSEPSAWIQSVLSVGRAFIILNDLYIYIYIYIYIYMCVCVCVCVCVWYIFLYFDK